MSVAVVGSINQDLVVTVPRHPAPGETVLGTGHTTGPGGKGANQAVAAARLGARVAFVARVGDDAPGKESLAAMEASGVDVSRVGVDATARTGIAVVAVDEAGENSIVVSPGANAYCSPSDVDGARELLDRAEVTLIQLEIPLETVIRAAELAGHRLVLNPAPARALPPRLLGVVDVLVPNRSELALLAGVAEPSSIDAAAKATAGISGPGAVVVTLGADGALVVVGGRADHIPAPEVQAVDTTGAGDAFCGALAAAMAAGTPLIDAVDMAVHAGALATTRIGAQSALPTRSDLAAAMSAG
jgi:ribokinase